MKMNHPEAISLILCGDVMTGRGIDQILPHPGSPTLYEFSVRDAREYVELAEERNGPIPWPVSLDYVWGEALAELQQTEVRIINLETSITTNEEPWPEKGIHYRMHPDNVGCLTAARLDGCCLANNHVLDWGYQGLTETLQTLQSAGLVCVGAGRNSAEARSLVAFAVPGKGRVLLGAVGTLSSGIPWEWGATTQRPGVNLLDDLSEESAHRLAREFHSVKQPGDVTVLSIHWGGNWGYEIPAQDRAFAHRLIDEGIDIVHGHSSHHVKAIERYHNRLILHGCGDFLNDYEGIGGRQDYRGNLTLMYRIRINPWERCLTEVRLIPLEILRFRLVRACRDDAEWLCDLLNRLGASWNTAFQLQDDNSLLLQ